MNIKVEQNGQIILENDRSMITVHPDGTIVVSSYDPVQLSGATLAKLDNSGINPELLPMIANALNKRLTKK